MASLFTLRALMALATRIGANPAKAISRSNVSFLGKGPTKNPLFQNRLAGLENATEANLGKPETLFAAIDDAVGWAKDGKLNSIQTEILGHNLSGIEKIINPPPLPTASVTAIRPGIEGLRRFPKETHKFFGRPLKGKDFDEIDRMVMEGKIPDARGRTWNLTSKPDELRRITAIQDLSKGRPPGFKPTEEQIRQYMIGRRASFKDREWEMPGDRNLWGPKSRLPETGPFQGWKPSVVPKVNIPASKINHQIIADKYGIDVELIKGKDWVAVLEVIRKLGLRHGGLARILEV